MNDLDLYLKLMSTIASHSAINISRNR